MNSSGLSESARRFWKGAAANHGFLAAALIIAFAAALPLWSHSGFLNTRGGGDSPFLLQRLHQLTTALADGHFPVRWMPDANYGYGYPFFNYYAPLSIYLAALFRFLGFSFVWAIQMTQLAGFLTAAWAMFALAKRWLGSSWAGLLASAAYTVAPFHMVNVYVRGDSLAEFWAMAFYPLALLALDSIFASGGRRRTNRRSIAFFALAFAALILSHNISALIFTPFLLLYLVLAVWNYYSQRKNRHQESLPEGLEAKSAEGTVTSEVSQDEEPALEPRGSRHLLRWAAAAFGFGLLLAAWFWLPALAESSLAQLEPVTSGYFSYSNHFRGADLVQSSFLFDYNPAGGRAFSMGLLQTILILAGMASLLVFGWIRKSGQSSVKKIHIIYIALGLVMATLLITALSRALWDVLPLLSFTQFPWRFLSVQAFFGALAVGGIGLIPYKKIVVPLLLIFLLLSALGNLNLDFIQIDDESVTAESLAEYEWFSGNIGSTVSAEYLPESVIPRPFTSQWLKASDRDRYQVLEGAVGKAVMADRSTGLQRWDFDVTSSSATIALPTIDWPGWSVSIDDHDADSWPAHGSGLIVVEVPAGEHQVELRLLRTPVRMAAELLSLAGLVVLVWLLWPLFEARLLRWLLVLLAVVLFLFILASISPHFESAGDNLNWDFDQLAYLHQDEEGVDFDNGLSLERYSYSATEVDPGQKLRIDFTWNEPLAAELFLELDSPAANRTKIAPTFAAQSGEVDSRTTSLQLDIPENAPPGPLLPKLSVAGASALTSSGQKRGDLYLEPLMVSGGPANGPDLGSERSLDVRPVKVVQRNSEILDVQLQWFTAKVITNNYNFSLRLVDDSGLAISQYDNQPGFGYQPSRGWEPESWTNDWLAVSLPAGIHSAGYQEPYSLVVNLYDLESGETVVVRHLGLLTWQESELVFDPVPPTTTVPTDINALSADFGGLFELLGYRLDANDEEIRLELYWRSSSQTASDFYRFVHLVDPNSDQILLQSDAMPRNNSFPTSQWQPGDVVKDLVLLDTREIGSGEFVLLAGLYQGFGQNISRLQAVDENGQPVADDRLQLPQTIVIER